MHAYLSSNNPELVTYVKREKDHMRDNPGTDYTYKLLMNRVKDKHDSLQQELLKEQAAASGSDPLMAIQSQVQRIDRAVRQIHGRNRGDRNRAGRGGPGRGGGRNNNAGRGRSGRGHQNRNNNRDSNWKPFPRELRTKAAPADHSQPLNIDGIDYWYCTKHKKWGKHPTQHCHKDQDSGNDNGGSNSSNGNSGNRNGRAVRALAAIAQHGQE